jgi:hypothetical protein
MPSVVQLPKKISAKLSAMTPEAVFLDRLRRVLAGGAAAEVGAGKQDRRALETRIVQRVRLVGAVGVLAHVVERGIRRARRR